MCLRRGKAWRSGLSVAWTSLVPLACIRRFVSSRFFCFLLSAFISFLPGIYHGNVSNARSVSPTLDPASNVVNDSGVTFTLAIMLSTVSSHQHRTRTTTSTLTPATSTRPWTFSAGSSSTPSSPSPPRGGSSPPSTTKTPTTSPATHGGSCRQAMYPYSPPTLTYLTYPLLYSIVLYPTLPYPILPYPTLPYPTLPYPTLPYPTLPYSTLLCSAMPYSALLYPNIVPFHTRLLVVRQVPYTFSFFGSHVFLIFSCVFSYRLFLFFRLFFPTALILL